MIRILRRDPQGAHPGPASGLSGAATVAPHDSHRDGHHGGPDPGSAARTAPRPGGSPAEARRARLGQPGVAARRRPRRPPALGDGVGGRAAAQGTRLAARPRPAPPAARSPSRSASASPPRVSRGPGSSPPGYRATPADRAPATRAAEAAEALAAFLTAFHRPAPEGRRPAGTAGAAGRRRRRFTEQLATAAELGLVPDPDAVRAVWEDALAAPDWTGPPPLAPRRPAPGQRPHRGRHLLRRHRLRRPLRRRPRLRPRRRLAPPPGRRHRPLPRRLPAGPGPRDPPPRPRLGGPARARRHPHRRRGRPGPPRRQAHVGSTGAGGAAAAHGLALTALSARRCRAPRSALGAGRESSGASANALSGGRSTPCRQTGGKLARARAVHSADQAPGRGDRCGDSGQDSVADEGRHETRHRPLEADEAEPDDRLQRVGDDHGQHQRQKLSDPWRSRRASVVNSRDRATAKDGEHRCRDEPHNGQRQQRS